MENQNVSIGSVFSRAFSYWKQFGTQIILVGFIVYLPAQILIELLSKYFDAVFTIDDLRKVQLINNVYELIRYLLGSVASLGIIYFIYEKSKNEEVNISWKEMLILGLRKWPKFMVAGLLAGLKVILYLLMLIIPGIIKGTKLSFVDCMVATKGYNAQESCDESEGLANKKLGLVFGYFVLVFFMQLIIEFFFALIILGGSDSSIRIVVLGVTVKLVETFFVVSKAVFFFQLETAYSVVQPTTEPSFGGSQQLHDG